MTQSKRNNSDDVDVEQPKPKRSRVASKQKHQKVKTGYMLLLKQQGADGSDEYEYFRGGFKSRSIHEGCDSQHPARIIAKYEDALDMAIAWMKHTLDTEWELLAVKEALKEAGDNKEQQLANLCDIIQNADQGGSGGDLRCLILACEM